MRTRHPDTIGCDVGGTSVKGVVLHNGRPVHSARIATPRERRPFVDALASVVVRLVEESRQRDESPPVSVGVGFCGLLDERRSRVVRSTHLPALDGCRLVDSLERRIRLPVTLDTDTNAGAVAEATLGVARRFSRVLYVSLGTGVGAALVVDGRPIRASHHTIGQISELRIQDVAPGRPRSVRVESLLSSRSILARARRQGLRGVRSSGELYTAARSNAPARRVWREVGRILGRLLQLLNALWSPDIVVIGGGTAGAADYLLPAATRELERAAGDSAPPVEATGDSQLTGAIGAALLARPVDPPSAGA